MQNQQVIQQAIAHWCAFLKEFRESQKITQEELGRRMAILECREKPYGRAYISYIEDGTKNIGLDVFFRYCTAVGARPVLQLLDEKEWIQFSKKSTEKGLTEFS
jgi:transcriptional regulator with XRE-family HTH domain